MMKLKFNLAAQQEQKKIRIEAIRKLRRMGR